MAESATPAPSATVKNEWILVILFSLAAAALHLWASLEHPGGTAAGRSRSRPS